MKNLFLLVFIVFSFCNNIKLSAQNSTPSTKFENVSLILLKSNVLSETRKLFIHFPSEYANGKHFPVLYLLDGEMVDQYEEALNCIQTNRNIEPHIIVGIETVKNRNRDLIPLREDGGSSGGGADKFLEFIVSELQPYINKTYRTNGENILYGASNAGLFTLYSMLKHTESFSGYISNSATIGFCPELLKNMATNFAPKSTIKDKSLFIYYGQKDHLKQGKSNEKDPQYNETSL